MARLQARLNFSRACIQVIAARRGRASAGLLRRQKKVKHSERRAGASRYIVGFGKIVAAAKFPRIYGRSSITERPYFLGKKCSSQYVLSLTGT